MAELELVRVYKNKVTGLFYTVFGEDDKRMELYCSSDDTGASDIRIDLETLKNDFELISQAYEEA